MTSDLGRPEDFWAGDFGNAYIERNASAALLASNIAFFSRILARTAGVQSVMEFGANIGLNLLAIRSLLPAAKLDAVEVNEKAAAQLSQIPGITVHNRSLLGFASEEKFDLTLSKGVLIHIHPDDLAAAYDALHRHSRRFICVAEYYNPSPVMIPYRGHDDRLFKRDFAGDMLEKYQDLVLVDYGFAYRRDPTHPQDDITWFLLERV